ncbi:MAG: hypothetical protein KDD89_12275 [Anaerolineales bacterium]|nr:hypothetical protein [Anaerolineales bacterium]
MDEERISVGARLANVLAVVIFLVAMLALCFGVVAVVSPNVVAGFFPAQPTSTPLPTLAPPTIAAVAVIPTFTPTPTTDPLQPTFTPRATATRGLLTETPTRAPTLTPSVTPVLPSRTPTPTATNTPTATPTEGPSPTATFTRSPFPFTKSPDSPIYLRNFANTAGCDWLGIAGEVQDTNGNPVPPGQFRVHISGSGIDERRAVGSAPAYGPSGWEQFVFDAPVIRSYNLQLETVSGTAVSQVYQVQTRASCNENLLYFIFQQNRDF